MSSVTGGLHTSITSTRVVPCSHGQACRIQHLDDVAVANRLSRERRSYFMFQRARLCMRKPVFKQQQPQPRFSLPPQTARETDRQRPRSVPPSSFRGPLGLSHHLEIPRDRLLTALGTTACYLHQLLSLCAFPPTTRTTTRT